MRADFSCGRTCRPLSSGNGEPCRFMGLLAALGAAVIYSHIVQVDVKITDLDALIQAARNLGLEFRLGQKSYRWYGQYMGDYALPEGMTVDQLGECDHALAVAGKPSAYEVGVVQNADGTYRLMWDFWHGGYGLEAAIGDGAGKLIAEYTLCAAERQVAALGWMCSRSGDALTVYHPSGGELIVRTSGEVEALGFHGVGCAEATRAIASALGVEVSSGIKPEYNECQQTQGVKS